jgi:hypothetical protein
MLFILVCAEICNVVMLCIFTLAAFLPAFHALPPSFGCYVQGFHPYRQGPLAAENFLDPRTRQKIAPHRELGYASYDPRTGQENSTGHKKLGATIEMSQAPAPGERQGGAEMFYRRLAADKK